MPTDNTPLRLLIVEDNEDDAALLVSILKRGGYAVSYRRVETSEALRAALEEQSWDVLTADHAMPQFNAPAAVALARALRPNLPIIIVSNEIGQGLIMELLRAGARDYIRKDDLATLPPAIARELCTVEVERQRQLAENALRESEARWQFALEGADEGVWDWNSQSGQIFLSQQWKTMLGYTENEVGDTVASWEALIHPDDRARVIATSEQHLAGHSPVYRCEYRIRCKDGSYKWILDRGKIISRTSEGKPLRLIGNLADITDRILAESELKRLKEFNEGIIQGMLEGVAVQDAEGLYTFVNPAACRILGRTPEELLGQSWVGLFPPDQLPLAVANRKRRLAGIQDQYEVEVIRPDGHRVPLLVSGTPRFENGQFAGILSVFSDLSERKQVTRQLQTSEAQFRSVVENAPWGMHFFKLLADGSLVLTGANPAADAILGRPHADLIGKTFEQALPDLSGTEALRHYREVAAHGGAWQTEQIGYVNGQVASAYALQAFQIGPGRLVAIFSNIIERKRTEEIIQTQADTLSSQNQELRLQNQELVAQGQTLHRTEIELRASEEKYRALIETTDTGYAILDAAGRVRDANGEYLRLTGRLDLQEILGHLVTEWTAPHDQVRNAQAVQACLEEGFIRDFEIDYVDPAGGLTPVEIEATVLSTEEGDLILSLCRDITERKQAERALRATEEHFRQLMDQAPIAMCINDADWRIQQVNRKFVEIFGYTQADLPDLERWGELVFPNPGYGQTVREEWLTRLAAADLSGGAVVSQSARVTCRNGEKRDIEVLYTQLGGQGTTFFIDVTERQQAQEMLENLVARLKAEIAEREKAEAQTRQLNRDLEFRVDERASQLEAARD